MHPCGWLTLSAVLLCALAAVAAEPPPPLFGGCGGAYLAAEPGELVVDVYKRDLHRGATTELRAILVGPDRRVVAEANIPFDGGARGSGPGAVQSVRLATRVERAGIHALNVTVSQDRYGDGIAWGLRTNCRRWLIETSRGHRDERHQEPIVLRSPEAPAEVCFAPRDGAFNLELSGLAEGVESVTVSDRFGRLLRTLTVAEHSAKAEFPPGGRDDAPWRIALSRGQGTIEIDGVTRWDGREPSNDLCYWTPEAGSWFDFVRHRWLLTPYRRVCHGPPGETGQVSFRLRNNGARPMQVSLSLEAPRGTAALPIESLSLPPRATGAAVLDYRIPDAATTVVLRATADDGFTTWSSVDLIPGAAPATAPLALPLVLRPYEHENEQFGHEPRFPTESQLYFDPAGRPYCLTGEGLAVRVAAGWRTVPFPDGWRAATGKVAFDAAGAAYVVAGQGRRGALLRLPAGASAFEVAELPPRNDAGSAYDLAQFSGCNAPDGPPALVRYTQTAADPRRIWRRINDLELFVPGLAGGRLSCGEPILVSKLCIGLSAHSGIPSTIVAARGRVHVVWGEATDPDEQVPGVPTYAATFDPATGRLGERTLVGHGPPANDVHNTPSITIDSAGLLHVLVGTHGRPFPYAHGLRPDDAAGGWTQPAPARDDLPQTYVGLVCTADGTLHTVFRLWRTGDAPFPLSSFGTLAYMRKPPHGPWSEPKVLVVPPFSEYSVYYHRLTIDPRGRLFLSYDYWSTYWFYRLDHQGGRRTVMMSPDGGETWQLAQDADLD